MDEDRNETIISNFLNNGVLFFDDSEDVSEDDLGDKKWNTIVKQILYLQANKPNQPLILYINSNGGSINGEIAVSSLLNRHKARVTTIALGLVASAATTLFLEGDERLAYEGSRFIFHNCWWENKDNLPEQESFLNGMKDDNKRYINLIKDKTKIKDPEKWLLTTKYLSAKQAMQLGIVTKIIKRKKR